MSGITRKRLVCTFFLLGLLVTPVSGQTLDPRMQPQYAPSPGAVVDGAQPVIHTTTCPGSPGDCVTVPPAAQQVPANWMNQFGTSPEVGLLDNFEFFAGLDGSKAPVDLGINALFGERIGFNWGIPLWRDGGLGFQIGVAENFADNALRLLQNVEGGTTQRFQTWVTVGMFQRTSVGFNWGAVYDFRHDDYYANLTTGQVRLQVGYNITSTDEIGAWGSIGTQDDRATFAGIDFQIRPIDQAALFWRHVWPNNAVTRCWLGAADSHGRFVLGAPPASSITAPVLFGADIFIPLNDCIALWGEASFITPNDTGTVTAFLGVAITPGTSNLFGRSRFAPYLPTANNNSFALDAR
jgi:hypothetical protein